MRKEDFYLLVQKYLDGKATEEETQVLHEWYDSFDDSAVYMTAGEGENETVIGEQILARFRETLKGRSASESSKTFVLKRKFGWMGIAAILLVLFTGAYFFMQKNNSGNQQIAINGADSLSLEEAFEEEGYDQPGAAIAFEIERTKNPFTGKVDGNSLRNAILQTHAARQQARLSRTDAIQALSWIERGPDGDFPGPQGNSRPAGQQTSGRIRASMIDSLDPTHNTVWVGGVDGGLWKTTNITVSPANWTPINDFMSNLSIAAMCQDPRPGFQNIMYICTGESYGNSDAVRGVGVFKSIDAGATWTFLPSTATYLFGTRILCDFQGNVYLGTRSTGLLRSIDGGTSWTNITPAGQANSICDLEISSTAVAARLHVVMGIGGAQAQSYRYTDIPSTVTSGAGWNAPITPFPSFNNRAEIAVSGNVLYALPSDNAGNLPTVYKSINGGATWTNAGNTPASLNVATFANTQGWYDISVGINPANSNECIVGAVDCAKTTTGGGGTWTRISSWAGTAGPYVHADQHNIQWWDGGTKLMFNCDGGVHFSTNGGATVNDRNKGLRLKQFYSIAIHPVSTNYFLAGAQDNGCHRLNHPGLDSSIEVTGGDGCYMAIDQNEPQFQYGSYVYNTFRRSINNGATWTTPVNISTGRFVNPWDYDNNQNIIYSCYAAGNYLRWNNPQTGSTTDVVTVSGFTGTVSAVHASPYTANRVYFGMGSGGIQVVNNAHTGTSVTATSITPAGASGYVNCVVTGSDDQNLMACYSSYGVNNVFISTNGGASWTAVDGNLPDMPVRWALFHPDDNSKAFIATETGVWETDLLNGASTVWSPNPTFPNVRVDMIKYRASDRTIAAGTHGRGIWTASIASTGGFTFNTPAAAVATCPAPATMDIVLGTIPTGGFTNPITVSSSTPPAGTTVSFVPSNTVTPGNNVTVRLTGTNTLAAGSYTLTITGVATGAVTQTRDITYTINPGSGPAITAQPANQVVCAGNNASFSITSATASSFQWEVSTDGGGTYNNVVNGGVYSNATTATLNITGATAGMNGFRYRARAITHCGTSTSNSALLTVNTVTAITSQPANASVCTGTNHTFTVGATGTSLTYQWEFSSDGGGTWNNVTDGGVYSGATTASLLITGVTAGLNNNRYRAVITGVCPPSPITSNAAVLTVGTSLSITGHPADVIICAGNNTSFTVTASGAVTYQWEFSTDGGGTYNNVVNSGIYSGATTATLNLTGVTTLLNGNRYRVNITSSCGNGISNSALLTVNALPAISSHPASTSVCTGANNTFSVTATGTNITYQWQLSTNGCTGPWTDIPGATSSSYALTGITIGQDNTGYRVVITGTCAPVLTSNCALLNVNTTATITSQPVDQIVCAGSNTSFSVTAPGASTYQWQLSTDGGGTWSNVTNGGVYSGATMATLNLTGVTAGLSGNRYRVNITSSCGSPTSNSALLTVNTLPAISSQPSSAILCTGANNTFSVTATGTNITYQWQLSTNGCAGPWTDIPGATSSSYSLTGITIGQNNTGYRVVITGTCPPVLTSNCALLTVNTTVNITSQPVDQIVCEGNNASFSVTAAGASTYQWQLSTDGGSTWSNVTNGGVYSGATTATLNLTGVTAGLTGNMYRVNITSPCGNPTSNSALLTVNTLPAITASPVDVTVCTGTNHTFTSAATGSGLGYQWQLSTDGGVTYNNIANGGVYSGATTANLTLTGVTIAMNNDKYRVIVTGTCPPAVTSAVATLTVLTSVVITSNPANQTICEATNTLFTVAATGGLNYQWQVSTDGGVTYTNVANGGVYSGATTATLVLTGVLPTMNGYRYRAVVSNGACTPGTSTAAILTVNSFPIISAQPQSAIICQGSSATFSVTATTSVGALSYQWQVSVDGGVTYTNIAGATTSSFAQTAIPLTQNNYRFRVIVTAGCGSVTSSVAVLTVNALPIITFNAPATLCFTDPFTTLIATPAGGIFSGPGVTGAGIFTPSLAGLGLKAITYTATNAGCVAVVSRSILVNECSERHLRLGDFNAIFIYPSPNNGNFSIRVNTDLYTKLGMRVFNNQGQLVKTQEFSNATYGAVLPVVLGNVSSGVYHIYLYNDETGAFHKRSASIVVYK